MRCETTAEDKGRDEGIGPRCSYLILLRLRIRSITAMPNKLELNCLVSGEGPDHIFPAFDHVPADTLVLWKVSIPVDDSPEGTLGSLADEESLSPVHGLSKVFSDMRREGYLHIVVNGPSIGDHEC